MVANHLFRVTQSNFSLEILKRKSAYDFSEHNCVPSTMKNTALPAPFQEPQKGLALKAMVGTATRRSRQGTDSSEALKHRRLYQGTKRNSTHTGAECTQLCCSVSGRCTLTWSSARALPRNVSTTSSRSKMKVSLSVPDN